MSNSIYKTAEHLLLRSYCLCMTCICESMCGVRVMVCVWRSENNSVESVLCFCFYVDPEDRTREVRLARQSHLPKHLLIMYSKL